jgi:PEP-CTERM motif
MKNSLKFSILPALLLALPLAATADSIQLGSYGTGAANPGFANTAMTYTGAASLDVSPAGSLTAPANPLTGSAATQNLTFGDTWAQAIGSSSWVSYEASGPDDPNSPQNAFYYYTSTFTASPGTYAGSISVLADDTAEILLNGVIVVNFANISNDGHCAVGGNGPTCGYYGQTADSEYTVPLSLFLGSSNTLEIIEAQTGNGPAGVDFMGGLNSANVAATPEPGSLTLLGTGLGLLALVLFRKTKPDGLGSVAHSWISDPKY